MAKSYNNRGKELTRGDCIIKRIGKDRYCTGAEIGVYKGNLSRYLLHRMPNLYLYMIDRWREYTELEKIDNHFTAMSEKGQDTFNVAYEKAKAVNNKFNKRSKIIVSDSVRASADFYSGTFHFVFIDADHSYNAVLADTQAWKSKVIKGGWIGGHDYHRQTVRDAVDEVFTDVETDDDNTWFVQL